MSHEKSSSVIPRIIIHGGAGNITRDNLPAKAYDAYRNALLDVLSDAYFKLRLPGAAALDIATYAVTLLENNGLFNAGYGAVYTTAGTHELEASVMVSRDYRKRGVGVMKVTKTKNPIKLAREMLIRGEEDDGGGAHGHCQLEGETCDRLAEQWGLELVTPSYFWTRRRWDEHRRGLGKKCDNETYRKHKRMADEHGGCVADEVTKDNEHTNEIESTSMIGDPSWDGKEYLPQGTVGAVVLDGSGTLCVATSTGGLTNKLPGRIGDTPTLGAGFWAEEWLSPCITPVQSGPAPGIPKSSLSAVFSDCLPGFSGYLSLPHTQPSETKSNQVHSRRAVAMSGTGNGDSFLRLSAVRTAAAMARFSQSTSTSPNPFSLSSPGSRSLTLQVAVTTMAGPYGMLQQSAEDRWLRTGEGEGGIIGIDFVDGKGEVVYDYNCGGMFHAWVDERGNARFRVFRNELDV